jgi:hypothetical protein
MNHMILVDAVKATVLANVKRPASCEGVFSTNPHTVIHLRADRDLQPTNSTIGSSVM